VHALAIISIAAIVTESRQRKGHQPCAALNARTAVMWPASTRWAVDEREALDLLTMVSVVHRRLEMAVRVPSRQGGAR
jgi:hypothetical protein